MTYKLIRQLDTYDCGAACVAMVLENYFNFKTSITDLKGILGTNTSGTSFLGMRNGLRELGVDSEVYKIKKSNSSLFKKLTYPVILQMENNYDNENHFVTLFKEENGKVIIGDPIDKKIQRVRSEIILEKMKPYFLQIQLTSSNINPIPKEENYIINIIQNNGRIKKLLIFSWGITFLLYFLGIYLSRMYVVYFDNILPSKNINALIPTMGVFIIASVIQSVVSHVDSIISVKLNNKIDIYLIEKMVNSFFEKNHGSLEKYNSGEIVTRINSIKNIREKIIFLLQKLPLDLLITIVTIGILLRLNTLLGCLIILLTIILSLVIIISKSRYEKIISNYYTNNEKFNENVIESINHAQTIKSFNGNNYMSLKIHKSLHNLVKTAEIFSLYDSLQNNLKSFLIILFNIFLFSLGAYLMIIGQLELGVLLSFNSILSNIYNPLLSLVTIQSTFENGNIALMKMNDIVYRTEIERKNETKELPINIQEITFSNFSFSYDYLNYILKDISFKISKKQKVAIVGDSGSGKTTFGKIIANYYTDRVEKDNIFINRSPLAQYDTSNYQKHIVYSEENVNIFSDTIINNILLGRNLSLDLIADISEKINFNSVIKQFDNGYNTKIGEKGIQLSLGQKQLLNVLRVTIEPKQLIIFDEITNGLDYKIKENVINYLMNLDNMQIFITHDFDLAAQCDSIYLIDNQKMRKISSEELQQVKRRKTMS